MDWIEFDDPRLGLYEICFPNEYTEAIVSDLCGYLRLPFDREALAKKLENDGTPGLQCLYIEQNQKLRSLLLLDCSNTDWLYTLCILYDETTHLPVKERLLAWDRFCREQYAQPRPESYRLRNKREDERALFRQIIHRHNGR
ncbi:hypothetical protein [Laceyella putida]|uniref:Uncharacterized protein n=1 Tax=Laceyella putida TaxID=110101 RepID=A0ABW2RII9_9BACL